MFRKLKWIVGVVVLLVVVGVVALAMNLDRVVRAAVREGTQRSIDLPTTLGDADVGLLSGDVRLNELKVGSPPGFSAPEMFALGTVRVDSSYGELFGEPVQLDGVTIEKPRLVIEFKGSKSNLKALADRLAGPTTPSPTPGPGGGDAETVKVIVDSLRVTGAQVVVMSDLLPSAITVDLPTVEMSHVGNADGNRNGEEVGRIVSQVIATLSNEASKSGKLPPAVAAILAGDLTQLGDRIGGHVRQQIADVQGKLDAELGKVEDKAREVQDRVEGEVGKRLGGLLGKPKE